MALVLGLHGILQEQRGRHQLLEVWRTGLADGIDASAGPSEPVPSLDICFYGRMFLPTAAQGIRQYPAKSGAMDDALGAAIEKDDLEFLEEAVIEVEGSRQFPELAPALGAPRVPSILQPLARRLGRRLDGRIALQFLSVLRQVKTYLSDDAIADQIRASFVADIQNARPRVVIAHSLGSVIAIDAISLNPESVAPTLITLGSPLAMRSVQTRLRQPASTAFPGSGVSKVARWVNIFDPGDPVAVAGGLSEIWSSVEDYTVGNGRDPHAILGYLGKRITGQVILDGVAD